MEWKFKAWPVGRKGEWNDKGRTKQINHHANNGIFYIGIYNASCFGTYNVCVSKYVLYWREHSPTLFRYRKNIKWFTSLKWYCWIINKTHYYVFQTSVHKHASYRAFLSTTWRTEAFSSYVICMTLPKCQKYNSFWKLDMKIFWFNHTVSVEHKNEKGKWVIPKLLCYFETISIHPLNSSIP